MNRYNLIIISVFVAIVQSCTDYQEEEVPVKFSVDAQELDFGLSSGSKTLTVSSGAKWSVASVPEWVGVKSIDRSAPYEWDVTFSVTANDEYNRDGVIVIKSGSEESQVIVTQEGKKGKYVAVESISLSAPELTIMEGENASLTYVITPTDASVKEVSWKSSSPYVATVSQFGRVDAITEGTTIILVTTEDGNKTASCTVTVKAKVIPVTGVTLDKASLSLTEGDEVSLTATVTPSDATDKSVTWSSSNTTVASVSKTGVVTAKSAGAATITATTNDGGKKAICAVTVQAQKVSATGVSLNKTSLTMTEGDTQTLTATVTPSNATDKSVTWSSSNTSVASVSSAGVVTAKVAGTATITVKTNDGNKTASCAVTVQAKTVSVNGVILDRSSLSLSVGDIHTLTATVSPANATDKSVIWSSSNTNVATVSSSGLVTAKMVGSAIISVSTKDGAKTATCSVNVGYAVPIAVDLGLGVKWASFNIGAAKPEDGGYYFAWGYTEPEAYNYGDFFFFGWDSYKWYKNPDRTLTKYCSIANDGYNGYTDSKTVLDNEDDAAYVILGNQWRIPTNEDFDQLKEKCSWVWTTVNGVNGYRVTGPNGNSIFLPAVGYGESMGFRNGGTQGYYWSSSLRTDYPYYAHSFILGSSSYVSESMYRCLILSIRPVTGVSTISISGVSLNKSSLSMIEGDTQTLTAIVTPSNATDKTVTWSSSNTSVATVSTFGVVTAKAAGSATITVTTNDGGKKETCAVTVKAATVSVTGVSLDKTSLSMTEGDIQTLTATVLPTNATDKTVTWSSSNTSVAAVSSSGVVTAKAVGTATITVTTNDGAKKATCIVTVKAATVPVTGVSLDKTTLSMTVGDTRTLTASVAPTNATDKSVSWSSSNTSVATVSSSGVVTAKSSGTATITVTTNDGGKKATCSVTVKAATVSVTGVSLDKTSLSMTVGDTQTLTATVAPTNATDKTVTWSSNNTSVATVSSSGVITAKSAGNATITVTTNDGSKKATCPVTVQAAIPVTGISLNPSSLNMIEGETLILTATVIPSNATNKSLNWLSSDNSVATVSSGIVTAKYYGTATITVKTTDNTVSATCSVTVFRAPTAVDLGLSVKWSSVNITYKNQDRMHYYEGGTRFAWGEITEKKEYRWNTYKWSDSSGSQISKYNTLSNYGQVDNITVLQLEDDAAHAILGGKWRIPTREEFQELIDNCDTEWKSDNGVYGLVFTSRINGNSIVIPEAPYEYGTTVNARDEGYYWTSSLNESKTAYWLEFGYQGTTILQAPKLDTGSRFIGCVIRPVCD